MLDSTQTYHDIAHTSHYTNTGKAYWLDVIIAESNAFLATNNAHGNATFADADIIAVVESWAEHVALTFAHKTYPTTGVVTGGVLYIQQLERIWNEMPNHIPIGIYHDLIDSGTEPVSWNDDGNASTTVTDNVSGFTNQMIFSCLNTFTASINGFQTQLINTQLSNTSNTQADVNLLFGSF